MGTLNVPKRPAGVSKPKVQDILDNHQAALDFLNRVSNAANIGTLDQDNFTFPTNDALGVDDSLNGLRRHLFFPGFFGYCGPPPGITLSSPLMVAPVNALIALQVTGFAQAIHFGSIGGTDELQCYFTRDGNHLTGEGLGLGGIQWATRSNLYKNIYTGPNQITSDPNPSTSAQFQSRNASGPLLLVSDGLPHTYGLRWFVSNSTSSGPSPDHQADTTFLEMKIYTEGGFS